jgi:hypothetical protein
VVESTSLLKMRTRKGTEGSNPSLTAIFPFAGFLWAGGAELWKGANFLGLVFECRLMNKKFRMLKCLGARQDGCWRGAGALFVSLSFWDRLVLRALNL